MGLGCPLLLGSSARRLRRCAATTVYKPCQDSWKKNMKSFPCSVMILLGMPRSYRCLARSLNIVTTRFTRAPSDTVYHMLRCSNVLRQQLTSGVQRPNAYVAIFINQKKKSFFYEFPIWRLKALIVPETALEDWTNKNLVQLFVSN